MQNQILMVSLGGKIIQLSEDMHKFSVSIIIAEIQAQTYRGQEHKMATSGQVLFSGFFSFPKFLCQSGLQICSFLF